MRSGFKVRKGRTGYFGAKELLQTDPGETGAITLYAQEYVRQDAPDRAIVVVATLAVGDRKETAIFGALAPQGDFKTANGFEAAAGGGVVFPHSESLWQCAWTTFAADCGPSHAATVSTGGVYSLHTCAGGFLRSVACSLCRCRGWCKWLAGCCDCR
jgi:hypothetical protein